MDLHGQFALMRIVAMHAALRVLEKHGPATPPPPASPDLYRELQAFTPDSLHYVLQDLFAPKTARK